ncbi:MAG: C69 family dipeptidase [Acidobacteria bacterium]|nr:C69 family dipeptidase [Acidobacteriota bacterium]
MCDTIVAVPPATVDGAVWFGKNSDREPGEAQLVEHRPAKTYSAPTQLRCTHISIPQANHTFEVALSRPFWMWGAEMGTNERGVTIGNEAVFTKLPYAKEGLTGMDLLRLALERADTAREALTLITDLISLHGQGGRCGYRNTKFRYHNSFIIADPHEAWVLETADKYWVAEKVKGIRTISNVLTIGKEFDLISPDAYDFARSQGWCQSSSDFDFAKCFGDANRSNLSAGEIRRACTFQILNSKENGVSREDVFAALRDHNGLTPKQGWKIQMPCAHASWWPTRRSGQTTGSMVSRLTATGSAHYLTGTSSPCLSVYKPVLLGRDNKLGDPEKLFWQHEQLHRAVLGDYARRRAVFEAARVSLQADVLSGQEADAWTAHQQQIPAWTERVKRIARGRKSYSFFDRYWEEQDKLDQMFLARFAGESE